MWTEHSERETGNMAVRLAPGITLGDSSKMCVDSPKSRPLPLTAMNVLTPFFSEYLNSSVLSMPSSFSI